MAKYAVVIELTTVEQQRIEIDAKSPIEPQDKIKKLMGSQDKVYSYLTFGNKETFELKRITEIKE